MEKQSQKIAVIGGGCAGILCIALLKEEGLDPICFEKTGQIGGTWCYREESIDGIASIMPTTVINHSKEIGALSDFPPRKEFNNFMRHHELLQYTMEYAEEKDVVKHIQLNSEVVQCRRTEDYKKTGRWSVTVRNSLTGEEFADVYDGVMVAVGHINRPKWGKYPFQETFRGKITHTHTLKGVSGFKNQNVVVVGMGCSGLDAAVEISGVAKQVYLSTRSGAHVLNRVGPNGYPIDYIVFRRYFTKCLDIFPAWLCSWILQKLYLDPVFDHNLYAVKPQYHVFAKDPVLNDQIGSKLLSGSVIQTRDIARFTEDGVVFEGDGKETKADAIIMATGYDAFKFPFLEEGIVTQEVDRRINLYKCIWPPHLEHNTLAIIGLLLPFGPGYPLGELQCRWAAQVLSGKGKLPSEEEMLKDIKKRHKYNSERYPPCEKNDLRVDYTQYMDDIASQLGVKPNFLKMFFTDIKLFLKLWFGPCVSYQFRLEGPHKWDGARDAIMTVKNRLVYPLRKEN